MRNERCLSIPGDILSMRDYVKRLFTHFNMEVQSDNFDNGRSLLIEGYNIQYIDEGHEEHSDFHSNLPDDCRQDTSTTHAHMISILNELQKYKKQNVLFGRVLIVDVSNIVVVHRYISFLYYRLTLPLSLIEW